MTSFDESKIARDADGKFAPNQSSEADAGVLDSGEHAPTLQTDQPLERLGLQTYSKNVNGWVSPFERGETLIDPPYQRGSVWNDEQRRALMNSLMRGIPCGAIITNDRLNDQWTAQSGELRDDQPARSVVDGRQRLETIYAWHDNELDFPASWFDPDQVTSTHDTDDGPYVFCHELTDAGKRLMEQRCLLPESSARLGTVQDEARLFRLVNGGGVAQTDESMDTAWQVEQS